jgi:DNA repair exonuclease SbcCD ATPase subunit
MKLLSLKAHNVFSIGTIELDLKDRGLLLVTGWSNDDNNGNAAGKSSVANSAISWGMYGKTVSGIKADAVINTSIKNAKHCGVTLKFEGIDGQVYRIYRSRKPNSLVLSMRVYPADESEEWNDMSQRNEKDTQARIDKLLGRDHKTFIQADFFGQGRERSFLALPGSEQRAVIEEILPLNSLDAWHDNAKAKLAHIDVMIDSAKTEQSMSCARERVILTHLHTLESQDAGWASNHDQDLKRANNELNEVLALNSVLDHEISSLKDAIPEGEAVDVRNLQAADANKLTSKISTLSYRIDNLTGDIDARAARPDTCNFCEQDLPAEKIRINLEGIADNKVTREAYIKTRGEYEAKLYLANSMIAICDEILGLEARVERRGLKVAFESKVALLEAATNPFTQLVAESKERWAKEQAEGDQHRLDVITEEEKWEHVKFWQQAFGTDLKTMLFEQVCPFLEKKANDFLADLQNSQITVRFSTTKELKSGDTRDKFCVTASSSTGSKAFELFSGAERQLTSFAVGMALSELASMQTEGSSSFMILDEPFLYQSPQNAERIVSFVTTHLVGDKATILLISNEDNLVNLVPNRVHVTKTKGVSSIGSS